MVSVAIGICSVFLPPPLPVPNKPYGFCGRKAPRKKKNGQGEMKSPSEKNGGKTEECLESNTESAEREANKFQASICDILPSNHCHNRLRQRSPETVSLR